ncbi:MAG: RluA family pseudouridine synthase [Alphaproteobacteria bacterium]|nr:RluA family pseudouridine synthase [Alphaproteobacteria bacterium]
MSRVQIIKTNEHAEDMRLDKWFKEVFPDLSFGRLQKMLRKGEVRVNGKKVKPGERLSVGDDIRVPPMPEENRQLELKAQVKKVDYNNVPRYQLTKQDREELEKMVIYKDDEVIAINKPSGLIVQGGFKTDRSVANMLIGLQFDMPEWPRFVHRIDKDTSGILILARTKEVASRLIEDFRTRKIYKSYWALVVGVPEDRTGRINAPLTLAKTKKGERMRVVKGQGQPAITDFKVMNSVKNTAAWMELKPRSGRKHQLRAHMLHMGWPIVGDGKYGGARAVIKGIENERVKNSLKILHLHARSIEFRNSDGKLIKITAPLPHHMKESFKFFGFKLKE